ncbi:MAG: hypothetical protein HC916_20540 [Coleofasciculaceae cyanobacterium SM2_1_6]|nr:hypothetical protein [Coleofasciculaceae cyanobacterium SM2_1_6]
MRRVPILLPREACPLGVFGGGDFGALRDGGMGKNEVEMGYDRAMNGY